jgi:hypothetical protein
VSPPQPKPTDRAPTIVHITLVSAGSFGPTAEVLNSLYRGRFIASKPFKLYFDADPRFIRVECDAGTDHLIPMSNVASLTVE